MSAESGNGYKMMDKTKRTLLVTGLIALMLAGAGLISPLMYDLNDDITLRSILSGAYTGTPDGHAVYMKYPLTGLISLLYRICRPVPWFSMTMAAFFILSVSAVMCRTLELLGMEKAVAGKRSEKEETGQCAGFSGKRTESVRRGLTVCAMALLCAGLYLMNFLKMHYTIVAAMLGGAALYLVVTHPWGGGPGACPGQFGKKGLGQAALPVLLLVLCYDVRSQVFFLLLPFLGVALLWQVWNGRFLQLVPFVALLAVSVAGCAVWNGWMYRDSGWKEYGAYNDSRTLLYDYAQALPYEAYRQIYEELGISQDQYRLLIQYDTALDRSVDQELLDKAAQASIAARDEQRSPKEYIRECLVEYYYYLRYTGRPYSYLVILGYLAVLAAAVWRKRPGQLLLACCMGAGRSLIWVYLIWKGRFPERIYMSLYLLELMLLAGMLLDLLLSYGGAKVKGGADPGGVFRRKLWAADAKGGRKVSGALSCILAAAVCTALAAMAVERTAVGYQRAKQQQEVQEEWQALQEYCSLHESELYLLDVTSMVAYSGAQYETLPAEQNYLLAGGWMSATPLLQERFEKLGVSDGGQALAECPQVSFIAAAGRELDWLEEYMEHRFGDCRMEKVDAVSREGQEVFGVYKFFKQ